MYREFLDDAKDRMNGAIRALDSDLAGFRTGRASTRILDQIVVEMYGVEMSLQQMAVLSVPEPQQLAIRPYDAHAISAIERAILKSDLGLNPNNDGKLIRLNIPRLTEERRRNLSRLVGKRVEEAKVATRNVRRDVIRDLREMQSEGMISEDDLYRALDELQEITNKYIDDIEKMSKDKIDEIMEV